MSLVPLPQGAILVATADPDVVVFNADGSERWAQRRSHVVFIAQDGLLAISGDGQRVDFGYRRGGEMPARFDLRQLTLELNPAKDATTSAPNQTSLPIKSWRNDPYPQLESFLLPLAESDTSRSLAIAHHGEFFILGSDWWLYAFDASGAHLWRRDAPGTMRAINITTDNRLAIAACDDGTIRWYRTKDGAELLALMPHGDGSNWVAWTPEGFYAATPGAHGFLRWHVNHEWNPAESIPVADIPGFYRPPVLTLILQELETP